MQPVLSVAICAYNASDEIGVQLDALAQQTVSVPWEVVVADNGSTDDTRAVLNSRQSSFPVPLRVIDASAQRGVAFARNVAAKASRGALIAFCDADDRVGDRWLQSAVDGLSEHDVVGGPRRELRDPFDPDAPYTQPPELHEGFNGPSLMGNNFALHRHVYFQAGGMDEGFPAYGLDDVELSARLNLLGARIGYAPSMLVYFRPTTSARELLRKVYLSGKAEYLVWCLYPSHFPTERTVRSIVSSPCREILGSIPGAVKSRSVPARLVARSIVEAVAHLRQHVATRAGRAVPARKLLAAEDDPHSVAGPE